METFFKNYIFWKHKGKLIYTYECEKTKIGFLFASYIPDTELKKSAT